MAGPLEFKVVLKPRKGVPTVAENGRPIQRVMHLVAADKAEARSLAEQQERQLAAPTDPADPESPPVDAYAPLVVVSVKEA